MAGGTLFRVAFGGTDLSSKALVWYFDKLIFDYVKDFFAKIVT
jgi:hypothetical protein